MNTAIEVDLSGNVNSSHIMGKNIMNGIGGSGDFTRAAYLSIYTCPSVAKGGMISAIVPSVSHCDHTEHSVNVIVTENGVADLRGKTPIERAHILIENCAHEDYKPILRDFLKSVPCGHTPLTLSKAYALHEAFLRRKGHAQGQVRLIFSFLSDCGPRLGAFAPAAFFCGGLLICASGDSKDRLYKGESGVNLTRMQKIFTAIVAASAAFVSACSASSEKGANREYVGASANVERAEKAFAEADYKTAKALCDNAVASVRKIVEKYPESTIALKVMTDSDTRIGPVAYFDLVSKIIPKLGLLYNPNLAEVGIAWPVVVNGGLRGGDVCALAALVQAAAADGKISEEAQKRISAELAKAVSDVFDKSRIERGDFSRFRCAPR